MEVFQTTSSASVEVIAASPAQAPILANLLELYIYDFSEFIDITLGDDGRFGYPQLPLYWQEPQRHPFLIRVEGQWAGFALVRRGSQLSGDEQVYDVAEFFILRSARRRGIGRQAAHAIWQRFPGAWEVRVINRNQQAQSFWRRAISEFIGTAVDPTPFEKNGEGWQVYAFDT